MLIDIFCFLVKIEMCSVAREREISSLLFTPCVLTKNEENLLKKKMGTNLDTWA